MSALNNILGLPVYDRRPEKQRKRYPLQPRSPGESYPHVPQLVPQKRRGRRRTPLYQHRLPGGPPSTHYPG